MFGKMRILGILLTLSFLVFTACGKDENQQPPQPAPTTQPGTPSEPDPNNSGGGGGINGGNTYGYNCTYTGEYYKNYPICCEASEPNDRYEDCYIFVNRSCSTGTCRSAYRVR